VDIAADAPGGGSSVAAIASSWTAETLAVISLAERMAPRIAELEDEAEQQGRAFAASRQRLHRISRSNRAKARQVALIKRSARAAEARREGAEASLQYAITAMSGLAQRRAAKKTDVRPGLDSGFVWPTQGRIAQAYGCTGFHMNPPAGSCAHFHDGIDIAGYQGTPIRAAAVGIVSYIGWNPWDEKRRAFMVVVAHPGGYETLYGHVLPTRNVKVGQLVRKGEVIGYMGSTGNALGVHLHLELRRQERTLNPLAFL
jgi:murein DD-endopeptidase MepM/ murein hydrolase activator NlpD